MNHFPGLIDHLLVLLLGLVIPFISGVKSRESMQDLVFTPAIRKRFYFINSLTLFGMAGALVISWWLQGRQVSELGFRPLSMRHQAIYWGLTILVVLLYLADTIYSIVKTNPARNQKERWESAVPFLPETLSEIPNYVLMCISAGVCEEIMYRGFMVTYFSVDFSYPANFPVLAAFIPALLFSLAHYYQGAAAVIKIALLASLFGLIFILSGSLWIVIIIHFGIDFLGGILNLLLLGRNKPKEI